MMRCICCSGSGSCFFIPCVYDIERSGLKWQALDDVQLDKLEVLRVISTQACQHTVMSTAITSASGYSLAAWMALLARFYLKRRKSRGRNSYHAPLPVLESCVKISLIYRMDNVPKLQDTFGSPRSVTAPR
ncbi:hypothetical protein PENSPDRAFT_247256 [Peniophora sp. CONT]|nr:hypothetical protein PENSPDRAFT_247256 [Peniophora sp. CONT]